MEGRCPGCQRAYDISDDFLGMGGKAKCPHCMLQLEFASDQAPDRTEASVPGAEAPAPEEVDSHCPSCSRRFKVDRTYLEMGNQAKCPHCSVDLEFDRPSLDHDKLLADLADELAQPDETGDSLEDQEVLEEASRGLDDLPSLEDGELDDDSLAFDDEVEEDREETDESDSEDLDASSPTSAEIPSLQAGQPAPDEDEEEEDYADEEPDAQLDEFSEKTDILPDTRPDHRLPEDDREWDEDYEDDEDQDDQDQVLVDSDDDLDPGVEYEDDEEKPTVALFGKQERDGAIEGDNGLFTGLATSKDWASAAAEWAESGFKAEDMPRFIQEQPDEEQPESEDQEQEPEQEAEPEEEESSPQDDISAVEVSDADIMVPEQLRGFDEDTDEEDFIEEPTSPEQKPPGAGRREATEPVIRGPRLEKVRAEVAREKARKAKPKEKAPSRLKSPAVMIPLVVGVLVVAVVLIFALSGDGADPETAEFSTEGLQVAVVEAPAPSDYSAKSEALEHYGQGNQYAFQGHLEDAVREYQQALRIDPGYPHPHRALGAVYAALGKGKLSIGEYETYLKLAPGSADANQVQTIIDSYDEK